MTCSSSKKRNLVWFKNDLRVYDNPALSAGMQGGEVVAVYFICDGQWEQHDVAPCKRLFMLESLVSLAENLDRLNVPLLVFDVDYFSEIPEALVKLMLKENLHSLYVNRDYEVNEVACLEAAQHRLNQIDKPVNVYDDQCLIAPGAVVNNSGSCYKVYSAFKRQFMRQFSSDSRSLMDAPKAQGQTAISSQEESISINSVLETVREKYTGFEFLDSWPTGEDAAHERLNGFVECNVREYDQNRDRPDLAQTSGLSPYLSAGVLSTRQCLHAALIENQGSLVSGKPGIVSWINELIWREFYRHLLHFNQGLCKGQPFKPETNQIVWSQDEKAFERWCRGETGFPLVDAAMKQLLQTGWMHNRLRMVTAMFLTKDLMVDWRWGERFFMRHLLDGDFASNNGGWQWSASTGADAVPYFRIFNPVRQSQRFDPQGVFIKSYLPQLAHLDAKSIHMPSREQAREAGYPEPIVDHGLASARVKQVFSDLGNRDTALRDLPVSVESKDDQVNRPQSSALSGPIRQLHLMMD